MIKILNVYQNRHALIFVLRRIKYGSHCVVYYTKKRKKQILKIVGGVGRLRGWG